MTPQRLRARLDESLFPPAPPATAGSRRGEAAVLFVAVLVLTTFLQLLRPGLSVSLDSLWAEDGPIFLQAALGESLAGAVFSPYSGYLVVVPRLIGEAAAVPPIQDAAATVAILAAAVAALSGIVVWFASAAHIRNPYLRGTLAVLTALAPVAGLESVASASYASWYMLFAAFWVLLWRPRTTMGAVLGGLFVLAVALSNPGVWFLAPLAALRSIAVRDRRDTAIVGAFWLGAVVQLPILALNEGQDVVSAWSSEIWVAYAQRVIAAAALGQRLAGNAWAELGWPFLLLVVVGLAAVLALALRQADQQGRWIAALAIPTSFALFAFSAYQRGIGDQMVWQQGGYHGSAGRYAIVPALLLVSVALVLVDRRERAGGIRRPSWLAAAVTAVLVVGLVSSFDVGDPAVRGTPPWSAELERAGAECVTEREPVAAVAISPPGFGMTVPCGLAAETSATSTRRP